MTVHPWFYNRSFPSHISWPRLLRRLYTEPKYHCLLFVSRRLSMLSCFQMVYPHKNNWRMSFCPFSADLCSRWPELLPFFQICLPQSGWWSGYWEVLATLQRHEKRLALGLFLLYMIALVIWYVGVSKRGKTIWFSLMVLPCKILGTNWLGK